MRLSEKTVSLIAGLALLARMPTFGASDRRVVAGLAPVPRSKVRPTGLAGGVERGHGGRVGSGRSAAGRHRAAVC